MPLLDFLGDAIKGLPIADTLRERIALAEDKFQWVERKLSASESDNTKLERQIEEAKTGCNQATTELQQAKREIEKARSKIEDLQHQVNYLTEQLRHIELDHEHEAIVKHLMTRPEGDSMRNIAKTVGVVEMRAIKLLEDLHQLRLLNQPHSITSWTSMWALTSEGRRYVVKQQWI
jgi:predicted transcriptional regulator